jgi:hypothetical protein
MAENNVPVAMIEVLRSSLGTEVHLQTLSPIDGVCWSVDGSNSPYLTTDGHRYQFVGGGNVTACPAKKHYARHEVMVLCFEPLDPHAREFSLVEGAGGERQMIDRRFAPDARYWNFVHVRLSDAEPSNTETTRSCGANIVMLQGRR